MMVLAIIFVAIGFAPQSQAILYIDFAITMFFVLEFSIRFFAAQSQKAYLKSHWIDLIALVPAIRFFRVFRAFRILRLLRLLALSRFFASMDRVKGHLKGILLQNGLYWILIAVFVVMIFCATGVYLVENGHNPSMHSFGDAIWWAIVTLTTVGYGDVYTVTTTGRIFSALLMLSGLVLIALLTSSVATYFFSIKKVKKPEIEDLKQKLDRIDEMSDVEIDVLEASFDAILKSRLNKKPPKERRGG